MLGTLLGVRHELRVMLAQGSGSIVNVSSTYGHGGAAYAANCGDTDRRLATRKGTCIVTRYQSISPRAHFVSKKPKGAIRHARQSVAAIRAPLAFALQEPLCARNSRTRATSTHKCPEYINERLTQQALAFFTSHAAKVAVSDRARLVGARLVGRQTKPLERVAYTGGYIRAAIR